jgi:glycosyltransferase involved in cell wall biosynthesis
VRARRLIAVSTFEAELFQRRLRLPSERFSVVPNGADLPASGPSRGKTDREELIVSVGRLERYKGHHRVIAALPSVAQQVPNIRLIIVGSGPYESELVRAASAAGVGDLVEIRSIPSDRRSELGDLLSRAGLVTLLSEYESQGISVMEAVAMGAPVLVADAAALGDLGRVGLVDTISLNASDREIGAAIARVLRAPLAPAHASLPTWDEAALALRAIYASILEEGPTASV